MIWINSVFLFSVALLIPLYLTLLCVCCCFFILFWKLLVLQDHEWRFKEKSCYRI